MRTSNRSAAPLLLAATAAAWAIGMAAAAPALAEPGNPADPSPDPAASAALPVVSVIDGMWNQYVAPNATVPPNLVDTFEQFVPTTTQLRDFFGFIQQFRAPAPITPPTPLR